MNTFIDELLRNSLDILCDLKIENKQVEQNSRFMYSYSLENKIV